LSYLPVPRQYEGAKIPGKSPDYAYIWEKQTGPIAEAIIIAGKISLFKRIRALCLYPNLNLRNNLLLRSNFAEITKNTRKQYSLFDILSIFAKKGDILRS